MVVRANDGTGAPGEVSGMDETVKPTKKEIATVGLVVVLAVLLAVAAAFAALVFGSYGCGKVLTRWLPFSPFEATVVSLLSLVTVLGVAVSLAIRFFAKVKSDMVGERCRVCGTYHNDEDDGAEDANDDDDEDFTPNDGLRAALFAAGVVKPNAPCPCGSGSRYSKCCGDGRLFRQRDEAGRQ
jgi:hypothetical protein